MTEKEIKFKVIKNINGLNSIPEYLIKDFINSFCSCFLLEINENNTLIIKSSIKYYFELINLTNKVQGV